MSSTPHYVGMKHPWGSLLARHEKLLQIREQLRQNAATVAIGSIVSVCSLVLVFVDHLLGRLFLVAAILTWFVPPLIRWRRQSWAKRLGAVAGIVFAIGLVFLIVESAKL